MQKRFTTLVLIGLVFILFAGCATKKMAKHAAELEKVGMYKEASEMFYRASLRKPSRIEYKTALRRAGFMYIEDTSHEINRTYNRGDYQKVVYDYLAIEEFVNRVRRTGVDLQIDHNTRQIYQNSQNQYLEEKYQEGLKYISELRYNEAKMVFSEIHRINPNYKDTKSYLNTATLEPIYQNGNNLYSQRNYMGAYREWERVAKVDGNYKDTRQRMQQALSERYKEGTLYLLNEDFNQAANALGDVFGVNPSYHDVRKLFIEARNEPIYRQAFENLRTGKCRLAFWALSDVLEDSGGNYKDAGTLRNQALNCASYPVAIHSRPMPRHTADGPEFENALIQSILRMEDPFVKIHTLPSINSRIHRSFAGSSGALNRALLRELHDRQGIKAVLVLNYTQYDKSQGNVERLQRTGFVRETFTNEQGVISHRDRQVNYLEYTSKNQVELSVNFQLIATHNGQVLVSQRLNSSEYSDTNYAVFDGELKNLYPATFMNGSYFIDERNYTALQKLFAADKNIIPVDKLREKVFFDISTKISDAVLSFNPER